MEYVEIKPGILSDYFGLSDWKFPEIYGVLKGTSSGPCASFDSGN